MKQIVIEVPGEEYAHYTKVAKLHAVSVEQFARKLLRDRTSYIEKTTLRTTPTDISARTAAMLIKRDEREHETEDR
ncbi:MAG TPA: hypothetical protein DCR55_15825 [Lentisphaeria bacterium]|jgi:hypothetical protein|nr:hypothetical protein [Lentisphaeria bacterium]